MRRTLTDWLDELRGYHRKDGQTVKLNDDLLSATHIAVMARRHAKIGQLGSKFPIGAQYRPKPYIAKGVVISICSQGGIRVIECFHYVDEDGLIGLRAKGITRRTLPDLAQAVGVDESKPRLRPDPEQFEQAHRQRRARPYIATSVDFDPHTGR